MENLVRSAMAPDTMVAAVAQNTVWKIRKPSMGNPLSMILSIASKLKKWGRPQNRLCRTSAEADEPEQDGAEHEVYQIFISTLAVFLVRMNPASTKRIPVA